MATKLCYRCRTRVPANQWEDHKESHKQQAKTEPHWGRGPEGPRARNAALRRDRYRCVNCHRSRTELRSLGLQLHVHHIDGDRTNNAVDNLECRCEDCHVRGGDQPY